MNRDLALENVLTREICDGLFRLFGRFQIDEGVADGTVGTRIDGDGSGLAVPEQMISLRRWGDGQWKSTYTS